MDNKYGLNGFEIIDEQEADHSLDLILVNSYDENDENTTKEFKQAIKALNQLSVGECMSLCCSTMANCFIKMKEEIQCKQQNGEDEDDAFNIVTLVKNYNGESVIVRLDQMETLKKACEKCSKDFVEELSNTILNLERIINKMENSKNEN